MKTATVNTTFHRSILCRGLTAALLLTILPLTAQEPASSSTVELLNQITQLRTELGSLRADIEHLQQQTQQSQVIARSQYLDLDDRLEQLERAASDRSPAEGETSAQKANLATPPSANTDSGTASSDSPDPDDIVAANIEAAKIVDDAAILTSQTDSADAAEQVLDIEPQNERAAYQLAFAALRAGDYPQSARLFLEFLRTFPNGDDAPNARYWLGESYYVVEDYVNAEAQFKALVTRYPQHDKTPGALLKVGLSQFGRQQYDAAEATLITVEQRYPGTDAAKTAADRLRTIQLSRLN